MAEPSRPDPSKGVFETLLVVEGHPVELEAHLARLHASLEELFPDLSAPDLNQVEPAAQNGVVRIDVVPHRDRLEVRISSREADERGGPVALRSLPLVGGLGAHKWVDRSLIDDAQAELPADSLPLIVDGDGTALEASRANLFAVRDGTLFTPPLDGRILPGVTRARVMQIAAAAELEAHETELSREDLLAADEVFLTGSVRGTERVRSIDGTELSSRGEIAARIAAELRLAWAGAKFG